VSLQPPVLDDLTWDAITEATRRRIPAESGGVWTLHAPADPGITLLELFAYLLEQRLYRLDQVPDALVVAVLRLLGLAGPQPARSAATVLRFEPIGTEPLLVPAGTVLSRDPTERITFTLDEDVAVLPFAAEPTLIVGGRDRSADLLARRGVPLLPAGGGMDEFRVELRPGPVRPPRGTTLSLLFELDSPAQCPPAWSPDAVPDVPPPAELTWSWYQPDGAPAGLVTVVDGTAGLRRSGVVRLRLPDAWCAGGSDTPDRYGLRVRTAAATFAAPPVLRQLAPNVGAARHRQVRRVTDVELVDDRPPADAAERSPRSSGRNPREQVRAWLRLPGQHLDLPDARGLLLSASLWLRRQGELAEWKSMPDLTFAGPADRIVVLDRESGSVRFGDGLTGAIPVPDPIPDVPDPQHPVVVVEYALGGGTAGNGGLTGNWFVLARPGVELLDQARGVGRRGRRIDLAVTARNLVPAAGGQDPETVAQARQRAGEELARVTRAVTAADFAELAGTTPGVAVARACVGVGEHPGWPCTTVPGAVTVRVVPLVPRGDAELAAVGYTAAVQPDPGLLRLVRTHLEQARLVGTELFVCPPRYRRVRLRIDLTGRLADPAVLRTALRRYLDPVVGGDDGTGWPFGDPLRPSALLRVAQTAVGDAAEVTAVAIGLDGAEPGEECADVPVRAGELVALELVRIRAVRAGEAGR
jgi:predicted phage baseplate assembly protein